MIARLVTLLPDPDSPTSPTLSPRFTAKLRESTARNGASAALRRMRPALARGYSFTRPETVRSGIPAISARSNGAAGAPVEVDISKLEPGQAPADHHDPGPLRTRGRRGAALGDDAREA